MPCDSHVTVGVALDPDHAFSILEMGPAADSKEVQFVGRETAHTGHMYNTYTQEQDTGCPALRTGGGGLKISCGRDLGGGGGNSPP